MAVRSIRSSPSGVVGPCWLESNLGTSGRLTLIVLGSAEMEERAAFGIQTRWMTGRLSVATFRNVIGPIGRPSRARSEETRAPSQVSSLPSSAPATLLISTYDHPLSPLSATDCSAESIFQSARLGGWPILSVEVGAPAVVSGEGPCELRSAWATETGAARAVAPARTTTPLRTIRATIRKLSSRRAVLFDIRLPLPNTEKPPGILWSV